MLFDPAIGNTVKPMRRKPPTLRSAVARSGLFDLSTLCGAAGEACHAKRRLDEGFEVVNLQWCVQLIKEAVHEPQVDLARHLWIIYCYLTERAAVQQHPTPTALGDCFRGEPNVVQRAD